MRRIWAAVTLLLICCVIAFSEFSIVRKECDYYSNILAKADNYISKKEFNSADELLSKTIKEWYKTDKVFKLFLLHEQSNEIFDALCDLREEAKEKHAEEFLSISKKTKRQLLRLKQSELPDLENII